MDCDRFEATLIDELYDELDELTSAAAKRHVAGCARCASLLGGLRATRRLAVLPIVEPSVDLEDRILAAARTAHPAVPLGRRLSLAAPAAWSWAMSPQMAIAAAFLLLVGSSVIFVRRSHVMAVDSNAVVAHRESAQASAAPPADESPTVDSKLAAADPTAAPAAEPVATPPPPATAVPTPAASGYASSEGALALKDIGAKEKSRALPASKAPAFDMFGPSGGDRSASSSGVASRAAADTPGGPAPSASGCSIAAAQQLDQKAGQSWGTSAGYQAKYDAAECYRQLGQLDQAQARFGELQASPAYAERARQGIARVQQQRSAEAQSQVATNKRAAASAKPTAIAPNQEDVPPAQAAPAAPPAQKVDLAPIEKK